MYYSVFMSFKWGCVSMYFPCVSGYLCLRVVMSFLFECLTWTVVYSSVFRFFIIVLLCSFECGMFMCFLVLRCFISFREFRVL